MYKLLNFRVDCPALLQSFNIYAPVRSLRPRNLFAPRELHTDLKFKLVHYRTSKDMNLITEKANNLRIDFDIFNLAISSFKKIVKSILFDYN